VYIYEFENPTTHARFGLVQTWTSIISSKSNLFPPRCSWKFAHLPLNNNWKKRKKRKKTSKEKQREFS